MPEAKAASMTEKSLSGLTKKAFSASKTVDSDKVFSNPPHILQLKEYMKAIDDCNVKRDHDRNSTSGRT